MLVKYNQGSRARTLGLLLFIAVGIIIVRLFQIQIIEHDKYVKQADQEYIKRLVIPAKRGTIYAMDQTQPVQLVMNETIYTLFADPSVVTNPKKAEDVIKKVAGGNLVTDVKTALSKTNTRYQVLATKLSRTQAELIKKYQLAGIGFQETTQRVYPEGSLGSQVLGFVNDDGEGQYGVEGALNKQLRGTDGLLESVTDISSVPLTIGSKNINQPAKDGDNVVLTIDRNVQAYVEKALAAGLQKSHAQNGSVIVMDPNSGKIMAMANIPTYDQSQYSKATDAQVFQNAVTSDPYEPGSVVKTFIMSTGIDTGAVTPASTYYNTDEIKVGDATIKNALTGVLGNISMQTVLNYSLNTGAVTVAERIDGGNLNRAGRDTIYDYYHNHFGFGQMTGVQLYEVPGEIISPKQTEGNAVRYSNMAFGQGFDATMLQVARAFSAVVNGGKLYQPSVVNGVIDNNGVFKEDKPKIAQKGVIKSSTSASMRQMLTTARNFMFSAEDKKGYQIGGKTGTSQVLINGSYSMTTTTASYLGFGGDSGPKYVIMVRMSSPGMNLQGNIDAEPVFSNISNWLIDYLMLKPGE
ncbi:penicillin-binding protein 2 [Candidatus Saccharibacteria bacterium]|nr:penicillin-binding protein 2 [Candidatus Saccharibacteria bacterium]